MTAFVYMICWTQNEGLTTFGMTGDPQNRKEWERWARSEYRPELRKWGKWSRAYTVPMQTISEAQDWEILMDQMANLRALKRKHPWRHGDIENGEFGAWCVSQDETLNCFNQALQQFENRGNSLL
jgi:hypothetical protein|tara:strand:- start:253 stop:627 length:375 start_codon:yes stop_codon:yes gene_type:complete